MRYVVIVLFLIACAASALAAPRADAAQDATAVKKSDREKPGISLIVPTTARLADILALHERAIGTAASTHDTIVQRWTFTDTGISGTELLQRSGTDYRSTITRGPFTESYGQLDGKRWHTDENGFTSPTTSTDDVSFFAVRVIEDAADPKNDVTVLGETAGPPPTYVVEVKRPGSAKPEWISFDKATGNIVRYEFFSRDVRVVQTYDDFRTTNGATIPWHIHDTYERPELDDDWKLVSVERGVPVPRSALATPAPPPPGAVSARGVLPSVFLANTVVVRMTVKGRGLDFLLDASHADSTIDRDVAAQLGLQAYGQTTHLNDGWPIGYDTILPDGDIGPVHLHDFRLRCRTFNGQVRRDTLVVGVLGSDFFATHVIHIDFVHKIVEAIPSDSFGMAAPIDGGLELPSKFDAGLLLVPMQFGGAYTDRAVVSNSLPFTLVLGPFYDDHPDDFQPIGKHETHAEVPFADRDSIGQAIRVWPAQSTGLRFAIADFGTHPFIATNVPEEQIDAILGGDYLRFFDLYFDYPHERFIVKPNEWFYKTFTEKSPANP